MTFCLSLSEQHFLPEPRSLALEKRVLSNYFGNIAFAYEDYGYPYCLAVTIFDTGISCPRDYSEQEITQDREDRR